MIEYFLIFAYHFTLPYAVLFFFYCIYLIRILHEQLSFVGRYCIRPINCSILIRAPSLCMVENIIYIYTFIKFQIVLKACYYFWAHLLNVSRSALLSKNSFVYCALLKVDLLQLNIFQFICKVLFEEFIMISQ